MEEADDSSFGAHGYDAEAQAAPFSARHAAALACPQCASSRVEERRLARRLMGALGAVAGASSAATRAWRGGELGAGLGSAAGPPGAVLGAIAGATLSALGGGTTGCTLGLRLGDVLDSCLLQSHRCLDCKHHFRSDAQQGPDGR